MRVSDDVKKSVVFIGVMQSGKFVAKATGFLILTRPDDVGLPNEKKCPVSFPFLVTADHVVAAMQGDGLQMFCRMNLKDGGVVVEPLDGVRWSTHPGPPPLSDVAVAPFWVNTDIVDQLYIPFLEAKDERLRHPRMISSVPLGAEIFVVGLFKNHYGKERNIPIIRVGNLAALPDEPISTKHAGDIEAYLVELRSLGGLSGSPVFLNPQYQKTLHRGNHTVFDNYLFLGLVHGHFDMPDVFSRSATGVSPDANRGTIHTGIGVVIPSRLIYETIYQDDNVKDMSKQLKRYREGGATADLGLIERERNGFGILV